MRALAAASRLVTQLRLRPWHVGLAAVVLGLVAGPRVPAAVPLAAVLVPLLASRAAVRVAVVVALLAGAVVGQARMQAVDATRLGPRIGHAVHGDVVLLEAPRRRAFGIRVATARFDGERVLLRAGRRVRWPAAPVGAILDVRGGLEALPEREGWMRARGVHAQLRADALGLTGRARDGVLGVVDRLRVRAQRGLERGVPPPEAALLRGMVLGDDSALPDRVRDDFRVAGLSHLVAASGQNVMLLAALVIAGSALVGVGLRTRLALVLAAIALYVPLAGGGASIQRAGVMGAAGVAAILAARPAVRWYALLLAAAATLTLNPRAIEDVGWQLSFAAVIAIGLLATRVRDGLEHRGVPPALGEAAALTGAATLGTAPLVALHFGQASLVSLPANVLAAPAVAPAMWLGMVSAALAQVSTALAAPFAALAAFPVAYVMWVGRVASAVPAAQVAVPVAVVAGVSLALGLAAAVRRTRPWVAAALAVAFAFAVVLPRAQAPAVAAPASLRVTFLDVGQGDATLLQRRTSAILVDTGPPDGSIVARLRHAGVRRLDVLVITHAQDDHDGGAAAVLRALPVGLVLDGRDGVREPAGLHMASEARRRGVRRVAARAGEGLSVGGVTVRILWPDARAAPRVAGDDPNQRAVVAEASADGMRVLLTADAESDVLAPLELEPVDLLKVSHHGSADPGLPALLERLRPRLAAIEVGAHNRYGHPAPSTLAALARAGVRTVRTDRDGSVRVEPAGGTLHIQAHA